MSTDLGEKLDRVIGLVDSLYSAVHDIPEDDSDQEALLVESKGYVWELKKAINQALYSINRLSAQ